VLLAFLIPTVLASWQLGGPSPVNTGVPSGTGRTGAVAWAIQALLVAGAVAVLVCVFLAGDSGARTVWGG
jgi:hypothetical protein